MRTKRKSWFGLTGLLAGVTCSLAAGEFAAPAEGPVAFRRDRVPLEADAMVELAGKVESLAAGLDAKTAPDRRGAAQMLALALALDPGNTTAREMLGAYQKNRHKPSGKSWRLESSRQHLLKSVTWLDTPDAGPDGQALAACLKDVIAISKAEKPPSGEQGAWAGWVPDVSAYETKEVVPEKPPTEAVVKKVVKNPILLEHAEVQTTLWQAVGQSNRAEWILAPGSLEMTATMVKSEEKGDSPFALMIGNHPDHSALDQLADSLKTLLQNQHGELPAGVRMRITSKQFESSLSSGHRQSVSAAAAVLASSAFTGRGPQGIIIGLVNARGEFTLSSGFWDQLQALGKGNGQRLVLPTEAAPYLTSILAMEKPGFFVDYEVLLASDFKQLLALTAKTPDEPLASASAKFREFRERMGSQDLRTHIGTSIGKQRLALVSQSLPSHASAKLLLIQASGNRPRWISRMVLAAELRRTIEPMAEILTITDFSPDSKDIPGLGEVHDICRTGVEALDRYAEKNDRGMLDQVRELLKELRSLDKTARSRGEDHIVRAAVQSAHLKFSQHYNEMVRQLADEAGDDSPAPKP